MRLTINLNDMAEISREDVQYRQIDQKTALYDLKLESPKAYQHVLRLREEHSCLMKLPIQVVIPIMRKAVDSLIEDNICKPKHEPRIPLNDF